MPRYAEVVGDPVAHSKSPMLHQFWLDALGLNAAFRSRRIGRGELGLYFAQRSADPDWRGCNLTAPLKEAAARHVSALSADAFRTGAVNCVTRDRTIELIGDNSDLDGIAAALPRSAIAGKRIILLGAGGAAKSAVHYLAKNKAGEIHVLARDPDKARARLSRLNRAVPVTFSPLEASSAFGGAGGLINASPIGMAHAPCPSYLTDAVADLSKGSFVFDMVYAPLETPLLHAARRARLEAIDGLTMLIGQAARAFRLFFEAAPPRQFDCELRRLLAEGG